MCSKPNRSDHTAKLVDKIVKVSLSLVCAEQSSSALVCAWWKFFIDTHLRPAILRTNSFTRFFSAGSSTSSSPFRWLCVWFTGLNIFYQNTLLSERCAGLIQVGAIVYTFKSFAATAVISASTTAILLIKITNVDFCNVRRTETTQSPSVLWLMESAIKLISGELLLLCVFFCANKKVFLVGVAALLLSLLV